MFVVDGDAVFSLCMSWTGMPFFPFVFTLLLPNPSVYASNELTHNEIPSGCACAWRNRDIPGPLRNLDSSLYQSRCIFSNKNLLAIQEQLVETNVQRWNQYKPPLVVTLEHTAPVVKQSDSSLDSSGAELSSYQGYKSPPRVALPVPPKGSP